VGVQGGVAEFREIVFRNNSATFGGAVLTSGGLFSCDSCEFSNNVALIDGGGLYFLTGSTGVLTAATFSGNVARGASGGGMALIGSANVTIHDSIFIDNSCARYGGAIQSATGTLSLKVVEFFDNFAGVAGNVMFLSETSFWGEQLNVFSNLTDAGSIVVSNGVVDMFDSALGLSVEPTADFIAERAYVRMASVSVTGITSFTSSELTLSGCAFVGATSKLLLSQSFSTIIAPLSLTAVTCHSSSLLLIAAPPMTTNCEVLHNETIPLTSGIPTSVCTSVPLTFSAAYVGSASRGSIGVVFRTDNVLSDSAASVSAADGTPPVPFGKSFFYSFQSSNALIVRISPLKSSTSCVAIFSSPQSPFLVPSRSSIALVGSSSFLWIGLGIQPIALVLVSLRDPLNRSLTADGASFSILVSGPDSEFDCPDQSQQISSSFSCSFQPHDPGQYSFRLVAHGDEGLVGSISAVWVGWVVISSSVVGVFVLVIIFRLIMSFVRRRRAHMIASILSNFTDIKNSSASSESMELVEKEFLIDLRSVEILRDIGSGATGIVLLGLWRGSKVAVKRYYGYAPDCADTFVREALVHRSMRHPNVVQLLGICTSPYATIMEFMSRGTLFSVLRDTAVELTWRTRIGFASDIARGMAFLHAGGVMHRDLKSLNVLVNDDWHCKIADFGEARAIGPQLTSIVGTCFWAAPEMLSSEGEYTFAVDVYSFGIILWEIASRKYPYETNTDFPKRLIDIVNFVQAGGRPLLSAECPHRFRQLIEECWGHRPEDRPTFRQVLARLEGLDTPDGAFVGEGETLMSPLLDGNLN
jgi:predicted outer membrane repeat protein